MSTEYRVLPARYVDSVVLMRLAQSLAHQDGIDDAAALMGTPANLRLLREGRFVDDSVQADANDLVVAVRAESSSSARAALGRVDAMLDVQPATDLPTAPTLEDACRRQPGSTVAAISVPGEYAAAEAHRALELGLNVFLFSSSVSIEDEVQLKQLARTRGLLCMGPDCGTAIVAGKGLGFANAVRPGPVGIVGAAGTGIQEVVCLLDRFGVGISHALGCGGRDLSAAVGGATAGAALDALLADEATRAIAVISKPPDPSVAASLRVRAENAPKPVVLGFLGDPDGAATLEEVARLAAAAVGVTPPPDEPIDLTMSRPGFVRGLYAGGTLAYEAQLVLREAGLDAAWGSSAGHAVIDLGSEELTRGRPHPMIDARIRRARLLEETEDPAVGMILLDVVLGYGAAADPAGDIADAIAAARDREVAVLAHVCGTDSDPQGFADQELTLEQAGAVLAPTNAAMARAAAAAVSDPIGARG